jgi:hypothetical protein
VKKRAVVIAMILVLLLSGVAFGVDEVITEDLNSLSNAVKNTESLPLTGNGGDLLRGLSKDLFNIARYLVITMLLVKVLMLFMDFSNAGDNPQLKALIKSKTIWLGLGIIVAINFWTVYGEIARVMSNISLL